jgi:NADPH-dependent 2,4-dienoyl-CoA reductase/sulfur reductase-like enzyme
MTGRLVVIGGDAAGMSAASQAKRLRGDDLDVVALERGRHVSYAACGIPYWVAGDVRSADALVARTAEQHRSRGIDLRVRTEAEEIDLQRGEVRVRDREAGTTYALSFDQLVIATGAEPVRPPLPGVDAHGIFGVQSLDDGEAVIADLDRLTDSATEPRRAVVVGCGYIGVEMAEALTRRGLRVTLVDQADEPMTTLDADMGRLIHEAIERMGCDVLTGVTVDGFETDGDGRVRAVVAAGSEVPADIVVLGLGVRPNTGLARAAGLPLGESGGLRADLRMVVVGHGNVWAAGDCVESFDRVSKSWVHVPLGTHANKQGRVAGINIGGGYATFPGVVRTAISKVCDLEIARTGLRESDARRVGFRYETVTIESSTRAGYFPGSAPMTVKMLAEHGSGRLLGVQIVGQDGAAKRIDACAVALWNGMTVEEMTGLDLAYAPPFSPVWDPVLIAARKAADLLRGS